MARIDWQRIEFLKEIQWYKDRVARGITSDCHYDSYEDHIKWLNDELREYDFWQREARRERHEKKN